MLVDEGRQAGKHGLVAVALQLHALITTKTTFESSVKGREQKRDESVLVDEDRQAGKHRLVAVALQLHTLLKQRRHLKAALQA